MQVQQHRLKKLKITEFNNYKDEYNKIYSYFTHMMPLSSGTRCTPNNLAGIVIVHACTHTHTHTHTELACHQIEFRSQE